MSFSSSSAASMPSSSSSSSSSSRYGSLESDRESSLVGDDEQTLLSLSVSSPTPSFDSLDYKTNSSDGNDLNISNNSLIHTSYNANFKKFIGLVITLTLSLIIFFAVDSTSSQSSSSYLSSLSSLSQRGGAYQYASSVNSDTVPSKLELGPSGDGDVSIVDPSVTSIDITIPIVSTDSPVVSPTFWPTASTPTMYPTNSWPTAYPSDAKYRPTHSPVYFSYVNKQDTISNQIAFNFTTSRDGYSPLDYFTANASSIIKYKFLSTYTGIVEPYGDMWINILDDYDEEMSASNEESYLYKYTICAASSDFIFINRPDGSMDKSDCYEGYTHNTSFNFDCSPLTTNYTVAISQYDVTTGLEMSNYGLGNLMCMYVRREIRSLNEADLQKTMDAMWKMWEVSEEDGQELYGEDFHNYAYLLEFHYFNAAWIHSDHIHEGNGFLAQHIKMSNIFELSMQRIDPSISLPYWDFTIEASQNISVWDSPIFTEDTFGTMPLPNNLDWGWLFRNNSIDDGRVPDGRWADFPAEPNVKYTDLDYAYGYMRAPWNMNPSKYLTRFTEINKELPSCSSHYELLEYNDIVDFLHQVPYDAHASTHGVIGGVFGCDVMDYMREAGYINGIEGQINLCKNWIFYLKEFYRSATILPDTDCLAQNGLGEYDVDESSLQCEYVCNSDRLNILILMLQRSVLNSDYDCVPEYGVMPDEGWIEWRKFICGGDGFKVFGGDHLESASPADPSFWPIHPTLERVLQAKYMAGGFDSDEWPKDATNEYVCNKATCYEEDESAFGTWDSCCYGHYQDDQMLDAPNADRYTGVGPTNRVIHDSTNPTNEAYAMPYIYDQFSWDHCREYSGLDFDVLISELHNNSISFNVSSPDTEKGWR